MLRPLAEPSGGPRPLDDGLQLLKPVGPQGCVGPYPWGADRRGVDRRDRPDRQQLCENCTGIPATQRQPGARPSASRAVADDEDPCARRSAWKPLRLVLTPGNTSDIRGAGQVVGYSHGTKCLIADRGDDADRLRTALQTRHDPRDSQPAQPQAPGPVRRTALQGPLTGGGHVMSPQGFPPRRYPVRRMGCDFSAFAAGETIDKAGPRRRRAYRVQAICEHAIRDITRLDPDRDRRRSCAAYRPHHQQ